MEIPTAIKLPYLISRVLLDVTTTAILSIPPPLRPKDWSYQRTVKLAFLRSIIKHDVFKNLGQRQTSAIEVYRKYMKKQKLEPEIVELEKGTRGAWIGSSKAKRVLLYFHGGGYVSTSTPEHVAVLGDLVSQAEAEKKDFSVFFIEYGLAPEFAYPTQLAQAVVSLKYLIETAGYAPENIFIAGDSAGGHLAISLLSHLTHPHPSGTIPSIPSLSQSPSTSTSSSTPSLGGLFLISPWVSFALTSPSYTAHAGTDYLPHSALTFASRSFIGRAEQDAYNFPLSAEEGWWKGVPVKDVFVVGGEYEVFVGDVEAWVGKFKVHNPQTVYYPAKAEVHVQMCVDRGLGLGICGSEKAFKSRVLSKL